MPPLGRQSASGCDRKHIVAKANWNAAGFILQRLMLACTRKHKHRMKKLANRLMKTGDTKKGPLVFPCCVCLMQVFVHHQDSWAPSSTSSWNHHQLLESPSTRGITVNFFMISSFISWAAHQLLRGIIMNSNFSVRHIQILGEQNMSIIQTTANALEHASISN